MPAVPVRRLPFTLSESSVLAIIPARYQSTRFPGKPLADLGGRPMIEHVYQRASQADLVTHTVVATDDARIAAAVVAFGGHAVLTSERHATGTDRLAELAQDLPCRVIVNVQGDEPLIDPAAIDAAVAPLVADPSLEMTTLARPASAHDLTSPHVVKVVCDARGRALYFSRAPIPFDRSGAGNTDLALAHTGLYGYRRDVLLRLASLSPTPLERLEGLEQLRALEHGISIVVVPTAHDSPGVDTPDDLNVVRQRLAATSQ